MYGTQTQGEIAEARGGPGQGPEQESGNALSLGELRGDAELRRRDDDRGKGDDRGQERDGLGAVMLSPSLRGEVTMSRLTMCARRLVLVGGRAGQAAGPVQSRRGPRWPERALRPVAHRPAGARARREQAVAKAGPIARDFVETQGDEAVAAIFACSKPVAEKLAEFHATGGLGKLPRPDDLLRAIAQPGNGDDVALWAIRHANVLEDTDGFEAYVRARWSTRCGLKQLAAGAAEARARRLNGLAGGPPQATAAPQITQQELILVSCGCLVLVALWIWRRRQRQMGL